MFALDYHDRTKHGFHRFARSAGRLDWATQPDPFRRYAGAPTAALPREPVAADVPYEALYGGSAAVQPMDDAAVADLLRCAFGLSAWKAYGATRWALRVNPSSGNLHPTEAYLVREGRVCHYAPRDHLLETRAVLDPAAWAAYTGGRPGVLIGLSSIPWREAWKYGERAFRYCQHDVGHALGALRFSASRLGWAVRLLPRWGDDDVAVLLGLDHPDGEPDVEVEEPDCLLVVTPGAPEPWVAADPAPLLEAARGASWAGRANTLSPAHVTWDVVTAMAAATRATAGARLNRSAVSAGRAASEVAVTAAGAPAGEPTAVPGAVPPARAVVLARRSAVAFDARSSLPRARFETMLGRLAGAAPPWDVSDQPPLVQLALFVHRVDGLTPGIYAFLRDPAVETAWREAVRPECLWEPVCSTPCGGRLFLLLPLDVRWPATRVSCDQDIAGDGFLSLGMLAPLRAAVAQSGGWAYRRLFWECGLIGQVLYLEAEAAGGRGTGIGCFYDDAVHELLGFPADGSWQSLYHFSMGVPVDDARLTTEPGYPWEAGAR